MYVLFYKTMTFLQLMCLCFLPICNAQWWYTRSVDTTESVSVDQFRCLHDYLHGRNATLYSFIGRVYQSTGNVDFIGIQNIQNFQTAAANFSHRVLAGAYMYPCPKCGTSGGYQVHAVIDSLQRAQVQPAILWLDIEDPTHWVSDQTANRHFIQDMLQTAKSYFTDVGIYTLESDLNDVWSRIVGPSSYTDLSNNPLWWSHMDFLADSRNFKPFGGWQWPHMHQFATIQSEICAVQSFGLSQCCSSNYVYHI